MLASDGGKGREFLGRFRGGLRNSSEDLLACLIADRRVWKAISRYFFSEALERLTKLTKSNRSPPSPRPSFAEGVVCPRHDVTG